MSELYFIGAPKVEAIMHNNAAFGFSGFSTMPVAALRNTGELAAQAALDLNKPQQSKHIGVA